MKYNIGQTVTYNGAKHKIIGLEFGPANIRFSPVGGRGEWVYYLQLTRGDSPVAIAESLLQV